MPAQYVSVVVPSAATGPSGENTTVNVPFGFAVTDEIGLEGAVPALPAHSLGVPGV